MSDTGAVGGHSSLVDEAQATVRRWVPYVSLVALFFLAVAVAGAALGQASGSSLLPVQSPGDPVPPLEPLTLFVQDGQAAALIVVGTVFVLPSVALVGYTAFQFGATMAAAVGSMGPTATLSILLPHGAFELPALWLAGAISLRWMHVAWQTAQEGDQRVPLGRIVAETGVALVVVLLLLAIAALVEGSITRDLAQGLA